MAITSNVLEAYLKCPTKCWLRSADEKATDSLRTHYARVPDESYITAEIRRLLSTTDQSDCVNSPSAKDLKAGKWRFATAVHAHTLHLESCLHAVECLPPERRGKLAQFIAIRFASTNKLSKNVKLLLAFDALALSDALGQEVSLGKIIHGDNHTTLKVNTSLLRLK